jgi:hypothetical protein
MVLGLDMRFLGENAENKFALAAGFWKERGIGETKQQTYGMTNKRANKGQAMTKAINGAFRLRPSAER